MNPAFPAIGAALIGLALGSIPFGLLLTRMAGLGDIRNIGSGNIGATNVLRTGRKGIAAATLLLDGLKGAVAVWLVVWLWGPVFGGVAAVGAVVGHCHPPWLGFRGGKGVATALGTWLALAWPVFAIAATAWLLVARLTRISSAGALGAMLAGTVAAAVLDAQALVLPVGAIALYVAARHRENIERLMLGTEPKIGEGH
ncbi:acyl-phosphate glycerol-3-phosphate acyltransferase [Humitalea rosea]|uniref:Glycerol-3-phosphate acyltransferase n=1 Tax=Humitalea rosea TaxID=990373 RepID=A0A2W7IMH3_9PROT|nr:glycerol-3-phosphate 1-O-acyltransferase PlsY [Humitalea rosea]PZW48035.1 acyl-phosphate glycerol-3-phosphate acyltransferase [Humitalea rosea]